MKIIVSCLASLAVATPGLAQGGDDCSAATPIAAAGAIPFDTSTATTSGFDGSGTCDSSASTINQDLFWQFTVPANGDYAFDTFGSTFDTKLSVHTGVGCAAVCAGHNDDAMMLQSEVMLSGLLAGDELLIQVGGFGTGFGAGTLNIGGFVDPCQALPPDAFEDNDDCGSAAPVSNVTAAGLNVSRTDFDFYTFILPAGATVSADILFIDADGDLDAYLWDPTLACDTSVFGEGAATGALALGFSASDNESLSYTNFTGAAQTLVLEVSPWSGATIPCNTYDLIITGVDTPIGTNYCFGTANTTGAPGRMLAFGSTVAADNDVTLGVEQLPPGVFGLFLASENQGFFPLPNSAGNLCLSGPIGRFMLDPNSVFQTDASGTASQAIDLTAIPNGSATVSLIGGLTWNFQAWHRDLTQMGLPTSNLSDAIQIDFL